MADPRTRCCRRRSPRARRRGSRARPRDRPCRRRRRRRSRSPRSARSGRTRRAWRSRRRSGSSSSSRRRRPRSTGTLPRILAETRCRDDAAHAFLPLAGIRVLDLTSSLAGPTCNEILGALGADVVKVEHPGRGDEARDWGPRFFEGGSVMFFSANAGEALARARPEVAGRASRSLLRLADGADVSVQSLRPGTAERLGFGADALRARNPRLVYATIGAFGRDRPARRRARLRPADAGRSRDHERHRRERPAAGARRRLADRHRHRRLGGARRSSPRCTKGRAARSTSRSTRRRSRSSRTSSWTCSPAARRRGRHGTASRLIVPYQVFDDRGRRADDRRRERPALREGLRRAGRARARIGPALRDEPAPDREPRGADPAAAGANRDRRRTAEPARAAARGGRARLAGQRPRRRRRGRAAARDRDPAGACGARARVAARSRSTASASATARSRRCSASTPRDPRARPATPTRRSTSSPPPAVVAYGATARQRPAR